MNKDTVVGILGAVILVAAMVAIFYYEGTQAPAGTATGGGGNLPPGTTFRETSAAGPSASGNAQGGTPAEGDIMVNATNVTAIEFTLTWIDDVPDPTTASGNDEFSVTITTPDNRSLPAVTSNNGTATVLVRPLCGVPNGTIPAGPCMTGTGRYHYSVEVTPQGAAAPVPAPVPLPGVADGGNDFSIASRVSTYQPAPASA
jgi:hypothetical protein